MLRNNKQQATSNKHSKNQFCERDFSVLYRGGDIRIPSSVLFSAVDRRLITCSSSSSGVFSASLSLCHHGRVRVMSEDRLME